MDTESVASAILDLIDAEPIHHESWVQKSYLRNEITQLVQDYVDQLENRITELEDLVE